jgi:hypothetical protein
MLSLQEPPPRPWLSASFVGDVGCMRVDSCQHAEQQCFTWCFGSELLALSAAYEVDRCQLHTGRVVFVRHYRVKTFTWCFTGMKVDLCFTCWRCRPTDRPVLSSAYRPRNSVSPVGVQVVFHGGVFTVVFLDQVEQKRHLHQYLMIAGLDLITRLQLS